MESPAVNGVSGVGRLALDAATRAWLNALYRALTGDHSLRYVGEVERVNRFSLEEIREFQLVRLRKICAYAVEKTSFYRERFARAGVHPERSLTWEEFHSLPVLTRRDLQDRSAELVSRDFRRQSLRASATGGTTSPAVPIYMDWEAYWRRRSATVVFDRWLGFRPGMRIAYLWGAAQDFAPRNSLRTRVETWLFRPVRFYPASPLDDEILEEYYEDLSRFRPFVLQAYPTPLEAFARFLIRTRRKLAIPVVSCTAEALLPRQRAVIQEAFGSRPFEWYGAREAGRIATECSRHEGMHINAYGLYVETATESGKEEAARPLLITDLWNRGFPLIRYEIGDLGEIDESPCACGSALPRLRGILGRVTERFVNSKGQKIRVLAGGMSLGDREIRGLQIVQRGIRRFEMLVVPGREYGPLVERELADRLSRFMGETNEVTFHRVNRIPPEPSGKTLFCRNAMTMEETNTDA